MDGSFSINLVFWRSLKLFLKLFFILRFATFLFLCRLLLNLVTPSHWCLFKSYLNIFLCNFLISDEFILGHFKYSADSVNYCQKCLKRCHCHISHRINGQEYIEHHGEKWHALSHVKLFSSGPLRRKDGDTGYETSIGEDRKAQWLDHVGLKSVD